MFDNEISYQESVNDRCEASGVAEKIDTLKQMHGKTTRKCPGGRLVNIRKSKPSRAKFTEEINT